MTINYDPFNSVWVAHGEHEGRPYLAEGSTPEEAFNEAVTLAHGVEK